VGLTNSANMMANAESKDLLKQLLAEQRTTNRLLSALLEAQGVEAPAPVGIRFGRVGKA
jgi:hypothetical protein